MNNPLKPDLEALWQRADEHCESGDPALALPILRVLAAHDMPQAMARLAELHRSGSGVPENPAMMQHWLDRLRQCAVADDSQAQYLLARAYTYVQMLPPDAATAQVLYEKAARAGHAGAQYDLYELHRTGNFGFTKDDARSRYWQEKALAQDHPEALFAQAVELNFQAGGMSPEAEELVRRAQAQMGPLPPRVEDQDGPYKGFPPGTAPDWLEATAPDQLERLFWQAYRDFHDGRREAALPVLHAIADKGKAPAMAQLAWAYNAGQGVRRSATMARYWIDRLLRNAEAGNPEAQHLIANEYGSGSILIEDEEKARDWLLKSAEGGFAEAQYDCATGFRHGSDGFEQHDGQAVYWLDKAVAQGYPAALYDKANDIVRREGRPTAEALALYRQAAEKGYAEPCLTEGVLATAAAKPEST